MASGCFKHHFLAAAGLVFARWPVGLFLLVFGFFYAGMILNALFVAACVIATFIEFAGSVCVVLLGSGIALPFAIVGNLSETGLAPWCVWALAVFAFLAGRSSINTWLLQIRAVKSVHDRFRG